MNRENAWVPEAFRSKSWQFRPQDRGMISKSSFRGCTNECIQPEQFSSISNHPVCGTVTMSSSSNTSKNVRQANAQMQHTHILPATHASLLGLPAELRLEIYRHLFEGLVKPLKHPYEAYPPTSRFQPYVDLRLICRLRQ